PNKTGMKDGKVKYEHGEPNCRNPGTIEPNVTAEIRCRSHRGGLPFHERLEIHDSQQSSTSKAQQHRHGLAKFPCGRRMLPTPSARHLEVQKNAAEGRETNGRVEAEKM